MGEGEGGEEVRMGVGWELSACKMQFMYGPAQDMCATV